MFKFVRSTGLIATTFALVTTAALAQAPTTTPNGKINSDRDTFKAGRGAKFTAAPAGYGPATVQQWAQAHTAAKGAGFKYVFVPADQAADAVMANTLRVAAGKAWNHLSWQAELDIPEDISNGAGLAFALNAGKIWGADADRNWGFLANCSAKANIQVSPAPRGDCGSFPAGEPVAIPRFVYNATNGGPYANIHKTPANFSSFRQKYQLSNITHTSTHKEAIVCGPRITAYRTATANGQTLLYSYSTDEFDGRDKGDMRYNRAPTNQDQRGTGALNAAPGDGNTAVASEWWMQLPNGFMYWGIHGEGSQERGKAEFPFAIDPANWKQNWDLVTGRSCITCHAAGIQSAPSDAQYAGQNGWSSNDELNTLYKQVRDKFQGSMRKLVENLSDDDGELNEKLVNGTLEPIGRTIFLVEGPYRGNSGCSFFCNGKYGPSRQNLCSTLPQR